MVNDLSNYNVYTNKDGRMRAYNKETHAVISYPGLLVENKLGRKLLPGEDVHHIDENPLNNDLDNLEVISHSEHDRYHGLNPKNRKWFDKEMTCPVCGKVLVLFVLENAVENILQIFNIIMEKNTVPWRKVGRPQEI